MVIHASVPWRLPNVGCLDPEMVLCRMQQVFGDDVAFDKADFFNGHYERHVESAEQLGMPLDSAPVKDAARRVRELSPRYMFRLRVGPAEWVDGKVDRYTIVVPASGGTDLPEPMRSRVLAFLRSLQLGALEVDVGQGPGEANFGVRPLNRAAKPRELGPSCDWTQ